LLYFFQADVFGVSVGLGVTVAAPISVLAWISIMVGYFSFCGTGAFLLPSRKKIWMHRSIAYIHKILII